MSNSNLFFVATISYLADFFNLSYDLRMNSKRFDTSKLMIQPTRLSQKLNLSKVCDIISIRVVSRSRPTRFSIMHDMYAVVRKLGDTCLSDLDNANWDTDTIFPCTRDTRDSTYNRDHGFQLSTKYVHVQRGIKYPCSYDKRHIIFAFTVYCRKMQIIHYSVPERTNKFHRTLFKNCSKMSFSTRVTLLISRDVE